MSRRAPLLPILLASFAFACAGDSLGDGDDQVPDGSDYCASQTDWDSEWVAFEDETLAIVNQRRAEGAMCGGAYYGPTTALQSNASLRCAARNHSADMAIRGYFDHDNLEGESFVDRINHTDYGGSLAGENIAQGYPTPPDVMNGWMGSDGHCRNIMNPDHTEIGVGFYGEGNYWTQVMGRE